MTCYIFLLACIYKLKYGESKVEVTLEQAIEIHARVLIKKFGSRAEFMAIENADNCGSGGDQEGFAVWRRVASTIAAQAPRRLQPRAC